MRGGLDGGENEGKRRETERARRRQALIELVIFKGTPPLTHTHTLLFAVEQEWGGKKEEVHTDFKKSHFLSDRCGVSFAV